MAGNEQSTEQRGDRDWVGPGLSPSQLVGTLLEAMLPVRVRWSFLLKASIFSC